MTKVLDEVLAANDAYAAAFGDKGGLTLPPTRRFAILTCMDARLDPAKFAGLKEGDATLSAMRVGAPAMMPSARLSSPTNFSGPTSGS
jgi:carbonic anhydrase